MNDRFVFGFLALLWIVSAIIIFNGPNGSEEQSGFSPQATDSSSTRVPGIAVDQRSRQESDLEEIEDAPVSRAEFFEQEELTPPDVDERLIAAREEYAAALVAEIEGPLPVPLSPTVVATLRQFAHEPIDRAWSGPTENRIFDAISATVDLEALDVLVECRATMCQMRIAHPPSEPTGSLLTGATIIDIIQRSGLEPSFLNAYPYEHGNPVSRAILKDATTQSINSLSAAIG